ncbi:MAG TPA: PIN domain nuclease [Trueperaceae bacterium]|nr:PIN domain nuclease [Trueperaceae bacterium]
MLVDSSVWVDYFRGVATGQTDWLDERLGVEAIAIGDLILVEVLQGFPRERDFQRARRLLASLYEVNLGGHDIAVRAASHTRTLRARGITVRKTIDTIIATRCIVNDLELLHADRDFVPFVEHLPASCP